MCNIHTSNGYNTVCPPVREDIPRAVASGLSHVEAVVFTSFQKYFNRIRTMGG